MTKLSKEDKTFLGDSNLALLQGPRRSAHLILWVFLAFFVCFLIWAKFTVLEEVTRGEGKVIPSQQIQVIQNLEGGIVEKIFVKEGEIVNKGQPLVQIDDTRFQATYKESDVKKAALQIRIERLKAEAANKPFKVSAELVKKLPDIALHEQELFQSRQQEYSQLKQSAALVKKELNLTRPLVAKGAASEVEVIRLERQYYEINNKISEFRSKALDELNRAKSEYNALRESSFAEEDRMNRTTVRSPVKGIVKQLKINTVGGVVQPGMDMMEIVPLDDSLLIEAKIPPKDVGFIHPGQKAMVSMSAYDFSIYGGLEGKVETISADTIHDEEQDETFYLVRVRTKENYLGTKQDPLYIIPGMTATVDILTGKKSVLDYLLKPFFKAQQRALTER